MGSPSGEPRGPGPLSGAFGAPLPDSARNDRFHLPESTRYEAGGVIGVGGMGEVRAVFDRRLGRMVARKSPRDADAAVRLAAEAEITARLVHPGIVTVLDAGHDELGRPCYTMPILHGRSLADVAQGATTPARLRLVRHLLDAARAVGFAHSQGVLHRDLKPDHVFVGVFGETIVVDWGLAGPIGEPAPGLGTQGFMPPEQRDGAPLGPPADVWSLGATLFEVLTGEPPSDPPRPCRQVCPALPPDLAAIVDQALHPDPARRYPDGLALAHDLEDWFEGRRVAAHRYSAGELLRRVWAAWRVPIVVVGAALSLAAGAVGMATLRAMDERDRARAAEDVAQHNLREAALARALDAMARDDRAEAEVLASSVLRWGPSPDAIGVLARFDGEARPRLLRRFDPGSCVRTTLSPSGDRVGCVREDGALDVLTPDAPDAPVRSMPGTVAWAAFSADDRYVFAQTPPTSMRVLDLYGTADPVTFPSSHESYPRRGDHHTRVPMIARGAVMIVDALTGVGPPGAGCAGHGMTATVDLLADDRQIIGCQDGLVRLLDPLGAPRDLAQLDPAFGAPSMSDADTDQVALFQPMGQLTVIRLEDGALRRTWPMGEREIAHLSLHRDRILGVTDGGTIVVWDIATGTAVAQLPNTWFDAQWREAGRVVRLVGPTVEDWQLPDRAPWVHLHRSPSGVAALAISPDGGRVASAHGDGKVRIYQSDRAEPIAEVLIHLSVAKDVAFSPDGQRIAAIAAGYDHVVVLDGHTGAELYRLPAQKARCLSWLRDGLLITPYAGGVLWWADPSPGTTPLVIEAPSRMIDTQPWPDRAGATLVDSLGAVWNLAGAPSPALRQVGTAIQTPTVASDGNQRLLVEGGALVWERADNSRVEGALGQTKAAWFTTDATWQVAAAGYEDGLVRFWSLPDMQVTATLRGHTSRVVALAFSADGRFVTTGAWDGDVRVWSTRPLRMTPGELAAEANTAWGADWQDLLGTLPGR